MDFDLLKIDFPNLKCVLLQLESQLTGDYKLARNAKYGTFEMPWDKWFGSFHDGSEEATTETWQRQRRMYQSK